MTRTPALATLFLTVHQIDWINSNGGLDWSAARKSELLFPVVGLPKDTIHREIATLGEPYDWVIIDGPPRVNTVAKSAIAASDIVVIPVQPSPYDIWAAKDTNPTSVVLVSHERDFLNNVVDHILHLSQGKLTLYPGGYDAFERQRAERQAQIASARAKQQASGRNRQKPPLSK